MKVILIPKPESSNIVIRFDDNGKMEGRLPKARFSYKFKDQNDEECLAISCSTEEIDDINSCITTKAIETKVQKLINEATEYAQYTKDNCHPYRNRKSWYPNTIDTIGGAINEETKSEED